MAKRKDRPSWFKMFGNHKALIDSVPDDVAGRAIKAVFQYFDTSEVMEMEPLVFAVFSSIKPFVDESFADFQKIREKNAKNIRKRWDNKIPSVTTGTSGNHSIPNDTEAEAEAEAEADEEGEVYTADEPPKTTRHKYGEYSNVLLSDEEIDSLYLEFPSNEVTALINRLSEYMASTGKKYQSHYATIRSWHHNGGGTTYGNKKKNVPYGSGELGEEELAAISKMMKGE